MLKVVNGFYSKNELGGKGGYSVGFYSIDTSTTLYIYVGEKGGDSGYGKNGNPAEGYGGWNGGGNGKLASSGWGGGGRRCN